MAQLGRKVTPVLVAGVGVFLGLATVPGAEAQTLKEALELAYNTNPALKAQRAGLRATDELAAQARADGRPTLNGRLSYQETEAEYDSGQPPNPNDPSTGFFDSLSGGADATTTTALELNQPLFQGFRVMNGIRQADATIEAGQADLVTAEQNILVGAVAAYLDVTTALQRVEFSETSVELLTRQREAAEARFEAGQATRTDVAQAEARLANATAQLATARAGLVTARNGFQRFIGQAPANLETDIPLPTLPATYDEALGVATRGNPTLLAAKKREEASAAQLKVAKGFLSPSLNARATASRIEGQFLEGDTADNVALVAELTVPFYQGGATWSGIRQAREANKADRYRLYDAERAVREQVLNAWEQVEAARAAYEATSLSIEANQLAFEGVQLENDLGQRTTLDVLNGEQELLQARLSNLEARQNYYLSAYRLLQAMGQATATGLELDVTLYDPETNKTRVQRRWFGTGRSPE
jgi:outer membrane protein